MRSCTQREAGTGERRNPIIERTIVVGEVGVIEVDLGAAPADTNGTVTAGTGLPSGIIDGDITLHTDNLSRPRGPIPEPQLQFGVARIGIPTRGCHPSDRAGLDRPRTEVRRSARAGRALGCPSR